MIVTEKLMPVLLVCPADRLHHYFLKKILAKKVRPIYEYLWSIHLCYPDFSLSGQIPASSSPEE